MSENPNQEPVTLLSIVMPAHNEAEVLPQTYERTTAFCATLIPEQMHYEIVFVNDGSTDGTTEMLDDLVGRDPHVRVVHLTRNFGHQSAVTAGLCIARGDVVAILDADLQDPPEVLPDLLKRWREGYQVVYAIRRRRQEWLGKRLAYVVFYRLLAAISEIDMPLDSGDFCVLDRSAVDLLNALPERQRFVRGLRVWIGLKQIGVEYERPSREAGTPSYSLLSLFKLAIDGLISFSVVPLRLTTRFGIAGVLAAMSLAAWVLWATIFDPKAPRGWASLSCLVLFLSSIQLISLGIMGEYLARIFLEAKERPAYLIARVSGGQENHQSPKSGPERDASEVDVSPDHTMPSRRLV